MTINRFVHLYMADLIAAGFIHMLHHHRQHHLTVAPAKNIYFDDNGHMILPSSLYDIQKMWKDMCSAHKPHLLSIHPNTTFKPDNLTQYESMRGVGWRTYIDYHGRPGE